MTDKAEAPDQRVRAEVFGWAMREGRPPTVAQLAPALGLDPVAVRDALARLASARVLALQPESGEILMAHPFSAVPTPFEVTLDRFVAYGNCIWDALGIPAALQADTRIRTACGCCGEAMEVHVADRRVRGEGVVHFAVAARRWWEDIVFT